MLLNLTNHKIKSDKIDSTIKSELIDHEKFAVEFISQWISGNEMFYFKTSGSTGHAKTICLHRDQLDYSAKQTLSAIRFRGNSALLCIPPNFIGGAMVIVRALIANLDLTVIKPSNRIDITDKYDLTSIVPMQLDDLINSNQSALSNLDYILVGGAPVSQELEERVLASKSLSNVYFTYGMTETASNVALRQPGDSHFVGVGDVAFSVDSESSLQIDGTVSYGKKISTNDTVELIDSKKFRWIGRKDNIINSGGIKLNPEEIESKLSLSLPDRFFLTSLPDEKFGQKLVLLVEGDKKSIKLPIQELTRFQQPKEIHFVPSFAELPSGKIDRLRTKEIFLKTK